MARPVCKWFVKLAADGVCVNVSGLTGVMPVAKMEIRAIRSS
jgi:hypothetical protein